MINLKNHCGVILYEGPSMIDGKPIVVIANRITNASTNAKTGAMVQTFIIRSDVDPLTALNSGDDASICGSCRHRRQVDGKRSCYVSVGRSVMRVWGAYKRGRYLKIAPQEAVDLFDGLIFRIGAYGDGAAAPFQIWRAATLKAKAVNGYTHQWREPKFAAFKLLCMASADSVDDAAEAQAQGWRTFRVKRATEARQHGETACPASEEAGRKTNCASCRACGGLSAKARASIVINAHGATASHF
jgi:hypothetical protein